MTGATGATGATGPAGPQGPAGVASASAPLVLNGSNVEVQASGIPAANISNRTRRVMISNGDFVAAGTGVSNNPVNFGVNSRRQAIATTLSNDGANNNRMTATFVVPMDYVAGQSVPRLTLYWGTDEGNANRKVNIDFSFSQATSINASGVDVPFRYNFRQSSSGSDSMESPNPAQGAIVATTIPEVGDAYQSAPTWAPGDVIVLTIARNNDGNDPNNGTVYILGVSFDYDSDM